MDWPRVDLALAPVQCAVVGAVATRSYMPERHTADLDVAIKGSDADAAQARLRKAGYELLGALSIGGTIWRTPVEQEVDVIESDASWWGDAIAEAQSNRDARGLPVAPLPYLVLMKLSASRTQDLADISRMMGQASDRDVERTLSLVERDAPQDLPDLQSLLELGRLEHQTEE